MYFQRVSSIDGWLIQYIPAHMAGIEKYKLVIGAMLLVTGCVFSVMCATLYRLFSGNIRKLIRGIRKVQAGDLDARVDIATKDEFGESAAQLNEMTCQIKQLLNREKLAGQLEKQAIYKALESQMKPHFLCNALDFIRMSTRMAGDEEIAQSVGLIMEANEMHEGYQAYNYRAMMDRFYGSKLLYDVFPALAREMCPEVPFVIDSPHGEDLAQSPVEGDTHTWGNFYNATKDPQFSAETCWYDGSHPRPQTIEKIMGLKMSDYQAPGWHKKWYELTGRELQGNHKYGEYYWLDSLADYMRSLEIEQLLADYQGMYYLRCRSSSCNGILYWPFNKGGMFIGFGCIDCDQRPLMAYYQLGRVFAPVVCHLYRDIDDIRLVAANASFAGVHATVRVTHMNVEGKVLGRWEKAVSIPRGNAIRLMNLENHYQTIRDRKREFIRAEVLADGQRICQDTLYFCMWPEFRNPEARLDISAEKVGEGWALDVTSGEMVKMLSIESDANLLWSDNYFGMMPGETRRVTGELLAPWEGPLRITVSALDCDKTYDITLEE